VSQKVHPISYAWSSRARRSGSGIGTVVREPGNPILMAPKPIRDTMGPFLPRGRLIDDLASMLIVFRLVFDEGGMNGECLVRREKDGDGLQW
jgi:hypothetical protein